MDGLTHSFVGLASAKAGLERLSPYTTAVSILAANAPDIDVVTAVGGRWTALHYHRGITHSIAGTLVLAILIPTLFYLIDRVVARLRARPARVRFRGLLLASLIVAATHPLMDWTNNYGLRPLLPWNDRWFYGDLVFIIDPYIWLIVGGAGFLLTSNTRPKLIVWSIIGAVTTVLVLAASASRLPGSGSLLPARIIWVIGVLAFIIARWKKFDKPAGKWAAVVALSTVVLYWSGLAWQHRIAYGHAVEVAQQFAVQRRELFIRAAAMPTAANPFRWLCVAETDTAMYRFSLASSWDSIESSNSISRLERFEKPTGRNQQLVASALRDPRAQILLGFARFPIEKVEDANCVGQTLVQLADLRYTEPGGPARGNFALDVPVECDPR